MMIGSGVTAERGFLMTFSTIKNRVVMEIVAKFMEPLPRFLLMMYIVG